VNVVKPRLQPRRLIWGNDVPSARDMDSWGGRTEGMIHDLEPPSAALAWVVWCCPHRRQPAPLQGFIE
jgi:hypothetical protein